MYLIDVCMAGKNVKECLFGFYDLFIALSMYVLVW